MDDKPLFTAPPDAVGAMILLHGLGASGADVFPLAELLLGGRLRVVCPHARQRAVSINGGYQMRAWYDIRRVDLAGDYDADGVAESADIIKNYIDAEIADGIPADKIFLAGFSQGAAMALHVGLAYRPALAGIIALSGYLLRPPPPPPVADMPAIPIFQAHGTLDPVVLPALGQQSRDQLAENGYAVCYREYPMAHSIAPEEINDINTWLSDRMKDPQL